LKLTLKASVPVIELNELSDVEPIDLREFLEVPADVGALFFEVDEEGDRLPLGLTLSEEGILSGKPAQGTQKSTAYQVVVVVQDAKVPPFILTLQIKVNEAKALEGEEALWVNKLQNYWRSFANDLNLPDIETILTREVSASDIYYLLERYGTLMIWNADDLRPADKGRLFDLKEISSRYNVYDFDVVLVATPKALYDPARTINDGYMTAEAMIHEIHQRAWNIEMAGHDKLMRRAWLEVQKLNRLGKGHHIEIHNYSPSDMGGAEDAQLAAG